MDEKDVKKTINSFEEYFYSQFGNFQEIKNPIISEPMVSNVKVNIFIFSDSIEFSKHKIVSKSTVPYFF